MEFQAAIDLYLDIIRRFEKIEGKPWGAEGAMMELTKQVGELSKNVMMREGYYFFDAADKDNLKKKIGNELADVLGQIIRIADHYDIDLLAAHVDARREEAALLTQKGV